MTLASGAVRTVAVGHRPVAVTVHPTLPRLCVLCQTDNTLVPIDTDTLTALPSVVVGSHPTTLVWTPDGQEIWVVLRRTDYCEC